METSAYDIGLLLVRCFWSTPNGKRPFRHEGTAQPFNMKDEQLLSVWGGGADTLDDALVDCILALLLHECRI
jgi:hypothetical protein